MPLVLDTPASIAEAMETIRIILKKEEVPVKVINATLGEVDITSFPERMPGPIYKWILKRVGRATKDGMDSSSASKRVSRKIKEDWQKEYGCEELLALAAFHINRERFNVSLRREYARAQNAALAPSELPQGNARTKEGRWFYETPPMVRMSQFGDVEYEPFVATLLTPDGKIRSDETFTRIQNAIRKLSGIKRGSPSQIMSKIWDNDCIVTTTTIRVGDRWRMLIGPMRNPQTTVSRFKDEDGKKVSVYEYEQSVLRPSDSKDVDELLEEQSYEADQEAAEGNTSWSCLPDMTRTYDPYTGSYYNSQPLLTALAAELGISNKFHNQGLSKDILEEIEALAQDYINGSGGWHPIIDWQRTKDPKKPEYVRDAEGKAVWEFKDKFQQLGFRNPEEMEIALRNEIYSINQFHPAKKTKTGSYMPSTTYPDPTTLPEAPPRSENKENLWQARIRISIQETREAWKLKQLRRFEGQNIWKKPVKIEHPRYNEPSAWSAR